MAPTVQAPLQHDAPLRHHHLIKAQIQQLGAETRSLRDSHLQLRKQMRRLEKQVHLATLRPVRLERVADDAQADAQADAATEVTAPEVLQRLAALENTTRSLSQSVWNATRHVAGLAALRGSTLQLLESLEALETKVDANVPAVQREISRLEFSLAQVRAVAHENKEDQQNQGASLKAMAASLSTLQERTAADHALLGVLEQQMVNATERQDALDQAVSHHAPPHHAARQGLDNEAPLDQVADDASVPHLVDELSHVQAEYEDIVHKLPKDCSGVRGDSGEFLVAADGAGAPIMVPCDMRTARGGWTVIQRRADGSQDFNRKWEDYGKGFGELAGEFWIGNEALHRLTTDGCMELRVELGDIYGQRWLAEYDQAVVGPRDDGYRLSVSGYRGNASDALDYQTGMEFSAPDRDRDTSHTHCAQNYEGGWWFSHCQHANLNGRYNLGLTWFQADRNEWIAVATSELKIRRKPGCVSRPVVWPASSTTTTTTTTTPEPYWASSTTSAEQGDSATA
ncbi:protein scabrous-like [Thrips palmi]|uniref:Protein scabrous-like n=1 Tax=Thrips palmi TaxID=161013 RepID=A0A6P9A883_THRPL|nr:protein scabrous-like [Thrips palmi]